jgi:hypothetical protein
MSELSKVLFPNKATGDTFSAAEVNEIKAKLNALVDAFNLTQTNSTPVVITPTAVVFDFSDNSYGYDNNSIDVQETGHRRRSPFATVRLRSDATSVAIEQRNDGVGTLTVYSNGVYQGALTGNDTIQLPSGTKVLEFIDGAQSRSNDEGYIQGAYLTKLTFPAETTNSLITPTASQNGVYIIGDSIIGNGYASTIQGRDGIPFLLRALTARKVIVSGYGARSFAKSLSNPTQVNEEVTRVVNSGAIDVVISIGNDQYLGFADATQTANYAAALVDALYVAKPSLKIYLFTRTYWGINNSETDYGDKKKALVSTRSWLKVIDPVSWIDSTDIVAGDTGKLHPVNSGNTKIANYIKDTLNGVATPGNGLAVPVTVPITNYTVTSKTTANSQAGAKANIPFSAASSSDNIAISPGWERWTSNVFVSGEALVTKDDTAALAIPLACPSAFRQAIYAPSLPDFGIVQISLDNGVTYFDLNQNGNVTTSDFKRYDNLSAGNQTVIIRKKPGQSASLYVCFDHAEYLV